MNDIFSAARRRGSGELRAAGPLIESEPLRIMTRYATLAAPPTLSVVEGVAVRPENAVPRPSADGLPRKYRSVGRQLFGALRVTAAPV